MNTFAGPEGSYVVTRNDASGFHIEDAPIPYGETLMDSTKKILAERQTTHGDFGKNAKISQQLKAVFWQAAPLGTSLSDAHREALDMIALKISRILSGHANFRDHWDDIAGYSKLASDACKD